jgi:hypothetical protein
MVIVTNKFIFMLKRHVFPSNDSAAFTFNENGTLRTFNGYRKNANYEDKNKTDAFYRKMQV